DEGADGSINEAACALDHVVRESGFYGAQRVESADRVVRELHIERTEIVLQLVYGPSGKNGVNGPGVCPGPCDRNLRRCASDFVGNVFRLLGDAAVALAEIRRIQSPRAVGRVT